MIDQEQLLNAFYEHSMTPLVFLDRDLNFIRVNEAYAKACGKSVEDFPGHNHFAWYPSEELQARFRDVVDTGRSYRAAGRPFVFPDRPEWDVTYWNLSVSPLLGSAGEVEALVFSLEDVTRQVAAEKRAHVLNAIQGLFISKESRKEYVASVVHVLHAWSGCANVGIRIVDDECVACYEAYVGFDDKFMALEDRVSLGNDVCACLRIISGLPEPQDMPMMTPWGSFICPNAPEWVAQLAPEARARYRGNCVKHGFATIAIVPIRYQDQPIGAIHLADERPNRLGRDQVESIENVSLLVAEAIRRFDAEEALRRIRAELEQRVLERTADLDRANDALQMLATFPGENPNPVLRVGNDRILLYANEAANALLESWKCRPGNPVPDFLWHDIAGTLESSKPRRIEYATADTVFMIFIVPIAETGYINIYGYDITARHAMEDALRTTAEELARSNQDLEQFAYVASHDLQEPLRMVKGYVELLEKRYRGRLDADADDFIGYAVDGCSRMQALIADLLAYSRVGTHAGAFETADCQEILCSALSVLQRALAESGAVVTNDALPTVVADKSQLVQLFQNLIGNAVKFRDPNRPLAIHIGVSERTNEWVFAIRDNGIGIEPRFHERIFVIFQRLHGRDEYPGTGIGLAICKKIVVRHGGRIWVESEFGKGSTFFFSLPKKACP